MKKWTKRLSLALFSAIGIRLLLIGVVLATTISFYCEIQVGNTSATSYGQFPFMISMNNTLLASNGYISSNGTDVKILVGSASYPRMLTDNRTLFVAPSNAGSSSTYVFTTGNTPSDFSIITGYDGYVTTADNASLEWGTSGNISLRGWFDPSSTGYILNKPGAITIQGNGDGSITASASNGTIATSTFRPIATGDLTQLTASSGNNYSCVGDNSDSTDVSTTSTSYLGDLYNIPNHTTEVGAINSVTVYFRINNSYPFGTTYCTPRWEISSVSYNGTERSYASLGGSNATFNQVYTTSPATGLAWTWAELDNAQYGIWLKTNGSFSAYCFDVWYIVNYNLSPSVTVLGVTAGEHTITLSLSGGLLSLSVS